MRRLVVVLVLCALIVPGAARAWTWPVDGPVLHPFVFDPAHPYGSGQHRGIDIAAPEGADVRAPSSGTVTFAGTVPNGGKTVTIETPLGYNATLLRLGTLKVTRGASVDEGNVVATAGAGGYVYFGLRATAEAQGYVDPLPFLPSRDVPAPTASAAPADTATAPVEAAPATPTAPTSVTQSPPGESPAVAVVDPDGQPAVKRTTQPAVATPKAEPAMASALGTVSPAAAATDPITPVATPATDAHAPSAQSTAPSAAEPAIATAGLHPIGAAATAPASSPLAPSGLVPASHFDDVFGVDALPLRSLSVAADPFGDRASHGGEAGSSSTLARNEPHDAAFTAVTAGSVTDQGSGSVLWTVIGSALALLAAAVVGARRARRQGRRTPPRIIGRTDGDAAQEDPGCTGVAVRERTATPRPRRGVRSPRRHLRALPPVEGERRDDGERHRRARDAGDGRSRSRGRLAA